MMRRLDENGDLVTSGKMFVTGTEEVALNIQTRLKLFLGEYFRDITDGTAWFQTTLLKNPEISVISEMLQRRIGQTEGVAKVLSLSATQDLKTRRLDIQGQVLTVFNEEVNLGDIDVTI